MNSSFPPSGDTHTHRQGSPGVHVAVAVLLAALILANMALIFFFSSESGEESGDRSAGVTTVITEIVYPDFHELPPTKQQSTLDSIHHVVRKTAHFLEYALLGFLTACLALYLRRHFLSGIRLWQTWMVPGVFCLLYAASDEIHQIFSNRGPRVTDVLIDFAGAVFGVCLAHAAGLLLDHIVSVKKAKRAGKEAAHL